MYSTAKYSLTQLMISSTLFACVTSYAAGPTAVTTVVTVPPTFDTTTKGEITISATGALTGTTDAITVNSDAAKITIDANNTSSIAPNAIQVIGSSGILVAPTGTNATITVGSGSTITSSMHPILMSSTGTGLTNNGSLIATGGDSSVYFLNSKTSSLINTGTIESKTTSNAVTVFGGSGVTINNSGVIKSLTGSGIVLENNTNAVSIVNTGSITTTNAEAINASAGSALSDGLFNSGTITAGGFNNAINFGATKNITITNNAAGTITGDVILSSNALPGTVLIMNGGTINGEVIGLAAAGARTIIVNSGTITNGIDLSASTKADTIKQFSGSIGDITGRSGTMQNLFILGPVATGGAIRNIDNIKVTNTGAFRVEHIISNAKNLLVQGGAVVNDSDITSANVLLDLGGSSFLNRGSLIGNTLTINAGATFQDNTLATAVFSGLVVNNGNLILQPRSYPSPNVIAGIYTQGATGRLETQITDKNNFGQLEVNGLATVAGNLKVSLTGSGFVQDGDQFVVIDAVGVIGGAINVVQPTSQTLRFGQIVDLGKITLEADRISLFLPLADSPITQGPAAVLDSFLPNPSDPDIRLVIGALDAQSNVNPGLLTLVPQFDGGTIQLTHDIFKHTLNDIGRYLDEHKPLASLIPCYTAGDVGMGRGNGLVLSRGTWSKIWGSWAKQLPQDFSDGYELESIGLIVGYDQYCSDRIVIGGAMSYASGTALSKAPSASEQKVKSFQLTGYSTYDYAGPGYLDVMAAVGFNEYESTRNILIGPFSRTALGDFTGWIYGVNLESGYRFSYGKYRIIPIGKLRYSYLQLDNYTETGAGGLNLSVVNKPIEEGVTSIGIKFNSTSLYQEATYVSEFRFNIEYDWMANAAFTTSDFVSGGPAFVTQGVQPGPCTYNLGISFNVLANSGLMCVLSYDVDLKAGFFEQTAAMKIRYEW